MLRRAYHQKECLPQLIAECCFSRGSCCAVSEAYVVCIAVVGHAKNFYSQIAILFRMYSKKETYLTLELSEFPLELKSTVWFELSNVKSFLRPWRSLRTGRISEADRVPNDTRPLHEERWGGVASGTHRRVTEKCHGFAPRGV